MTAISCLRKTFCDASTISIALYSKGNPSYFFSSFAGICILFPFVFDPIIYFIVLGRGDNIDVGLRNLPPLQSTGRTVTDGNPVPVQLAHDYERSVDDMLIAYSTLPGEL